MGLLFFMHHSVYINTNKVICIPVFLIQRWTHCIREAPPQNITWLILPSYWENSEFNICERCSSSLATIFSKPFAVRWVLYVVSLNVKRSLLCNYERCQYFVWTVDNHQNWWQHLAVLTLVAQHLLLAWCNIFLLESVTHQNNFKIQWNKKTNANNLQRWSGRSVKERSWSSNVHTTHGMSIVNCAWCFLLICPYLITQKASFYDRW